MADEASRRNLTGWRRALAAVGIVFPPGSRWRVHLTPRFFAVLGVLLALLAAGLGGVAKFSESPAFCHSCHIMEPYYQAWKTSPHNKIACVECHYPPGTPRTLLWKKFQALSQVAKYVTRTYSSKPFAEVEDSSCLRSGCHSTRLLQGRVLSAKGIKFDHRPHLESPRRGRQLRCVSCHSQVMVGQHIEVTYDTCYLCHLKGMGSGRNLKPLGGCLGCHTLPSKTLHLAGMEYNHKDFVSKRSLSCLDCHADSVRGEGDAPKDRCLTCHNQPEKLEHYADIPFIHQNHVTRHNIACFHCHQEMRHGFVSAGERSSQHAVPASTAAPAAGHGLAFDCGLCHNNKHSGPLAMYTGRARPFGLPEMPSPMFSAHVGCMGCHYAPATDGKSEKLNGKTFRASKDACVKCHGPAFGGIWEETRLELERTLSRLDPKLAAARKALGEFRAQDGKRKELHARLEQAEGWRDFVRLSRGAHNVYLASLALRKADAALTEVGRAAGKDLGDLSGLPLISGSYCATLCHAKVGVKVPPATVRARGKTMPHGAHADMMGCARCHEIAGHKQVPLRKDAPAVCAECHPE